MRRHYLDNIRWITIVLVVIFHIFFYYNNIGTEPMFQGLGEYQGQVGFGGIYQYFVYPWFMLLLFIVSGISARISMEKTTAKAFFKARVDKILVPSTLGVITFGWIGGYIIYLHMAKPNAVDVPAFVGVIISVLSGIGALWFCHVLFVAVIVLLMVRWMIIKCHGNDEKVCQWFSAKCSNPAGFMIVMVMLYFILWGSSHILNMPIITSYRNGIYISAFFMGYYIFSNNECIEMCKKSAVPLFVLAIASGIFYITRCYGLVYSDAAVLARWDLNLYAFLMVLLIFGGAAKFLDFQNGFTDYMRKSGFGIYVFHIPVMLVTNYLLVGSGLPMTAIYIIELVTAFIMSIVLYEIIRRIPVLRYCTLGIRKSK